MPDYMYMLESRLSAEQRAALKRVQEAAATTSSNVYLTGGAVRDLISGMPIRDLDFTVEGNPARLARELEKDGAKTLHEDDKTREIEMLFAGEVMGSLCAAREDVYARPGTRPEIRWSSIMEDLHRRDFSLNAIAISLNPASRGLLLDPTNGLADLENREVRALSIHSFTNQPVRLMRALRFSTRMEFRLESRTADWFALALERKLEQTIPPGDIGGELRELSREEKPGAILKAWEAKGLLGLIHPQLVRRHPDYEMMSRLLRARDDLRSSGLHARLSTQILYAVLEKLKPRERSAALHRLEFRAAEIEAVAGLEDEAQKIVKTLTGRKTASPADAFHFLESIPTDMVLFVMTESSNSKAVNKIRNYLQRWRPLRQALPAAILDLEGLGMPRGPKFDKVVETLFQQQLLGKGRSPEDRVKLLRKLSGIKEPSKKIVKEEKKKPDEKLKKKLIAKGQSAAGGQPESLESPAGAPQPAAEPSQAQSSHASDGSATAKKGAKADAHAATGRSRSLRSSKTATRKKG